MSKNGHIRFLEAELKNIGLKLQAAEDRAQARSDADDKAEVAARELKRVTEEAATLKSIRDGFVPVSVLRGMIDADYNVAYFKRESRVTTFELRLRDDDTVHTAVKNAILGRTGYATGGFTGVQSVPVTLGQDSRALLAKLNTSNWGVV